MKSVQRSDTIAEYPTVVIALTSDEKTELAGWIARDRDQVNRSEHMDEVLSGKPLVLN